ncbi:MAG: hypothetical protein QXI93_05620 [Candidatus Methanomethylicia archaeon]
MLQSNSLLEEKSILEDLKFRCVSYIFLFCIVFWFMILAFHIHFIFGSLFILIEVYVANSYRVYRRKIRDLARKLGVSLPWWL